MVKYDQEQSERIFKMPGLWFVAELLLSVPARAFSLYGFPFVCFTVSVLLPFYEQEVKRMKAYNDGGDF